MFVFSSSSLTSEGDMWYVRSWVTTLTRLTWPAQITAQCWGKHIRKHINFSLEKKTLFLKTKSPIYNPHLQLLCLICKRNSLRLFSPSTRNRCYCWVLWFYEVSYAKSFYFIALQTTIENYGSQWVHFSTKLVLRNSFCSKLKWFLALRMATNFNLFYISFKRSNSSCLKWLKLS